MTEEGHDEGLDRGQRRCRHRRPLATTRRRLLTGTAVGATTALAGCGGFSGDGGTPTDVPEPVSLSADDACELCGMVIPNYPGPSAEIFYRDHTPSDHPNPAVFDSTKEAFQYDFERAARDWERTVMYVTDYSTVEYELREREGRTLISSHVEAEAFTDAREVTFVAGSAIEGSMGKDLIAFSAAADAESFRDDHGGELVTLAEVTPDLLARL